MNELEIRIFELLKRHKGRNSAITVKEIKSKVGSDGRSIRQSIACLVQKYRCPIASSVHPPYGFYFIANKREAKDCLSQYWSRISELSKRAKALNKTIKAKFGKKHQKEFKFNENMQPPARKRPHKNSK